MNACVGIFCGNSLPANHPPLWMQIVSSSYSIIYDDTLSCPAGNYNFTGGGGPGGGGLPPNQTTTFSSPAFCFPCLNNVLNSESQWSSAQLLRACANALQCLTSSDELMTLRRVCRRLHLAADCVQRDHARQQHPGAWCSLMVLYDMLNVV